MTESNRPQSESSLSDSSSLDPGRDVDRVCEDALRSLVPGGFDSDQLIFRAGYHDGVRDQAARHQPRMRSSRVLQLAASLLLGVSMGTVGMGLSNRSRQVDRMVDAPRVAEMTASESTNSNFATARQTDIVDADADFQSLSPIRLAAVEYVRAGEGLGTRSNLAFVESEFSPFAVDVDANSGNLRPARSLDQGVMTLREALRREVDSRS